MGNQEIADFKREMRSQMLKRRRGMGREERFSLSRRIRDRIRLQDCFRKARRLFAYYPFADEVDLVELLEEVKGNGKEVFLPRIGRADGRLTFHLWGDAPLEDGPFGTREPSPAEPMFDAGESPDLILIPGVAFDRTGGRLGYGKGYYDRFLAGFSSIPPLLAPAFSLQVVDLVPIDPWDHRVDAIVTEEEWIDSSPPFLYNRCGSVDKD